MSMYERIMDIFDDELNERLVAMMNEYVEIISKKHGIAMDLLLKDIPKTFSGTVCKGTKKNDGRRCTFRAGRDGYCKHHHTHGPEQGFVEGCPGCAISKELIDLNTMIGNEQI